MLFHYTLRCHCPYIQSCAVRNCGLVKTCWAFSPFVCQRNCRSMPLFQVGFVTYLGVSLKFNRC